MPSILTISRQGDVRIRKERKKERKKERDDEYKRANSERLTTTDNYERVQQPVATRQETAHSTEQHEAVQWIHLAPHRSSRALVNTVMNLRVAQNGAGFLTERCIVLQLACVMWFRHHGPYKRRTWQQKPLFRYKTGNQNKSER
jgi:hypothetical protein